jgi:hypothetical protein
MHAALHTAAVPPPPRVSRALTVDCADDTTMTTQVSLFAAHCDALLKQTAAGGLTDGVRRTLAKCTMLVSHASDKELFVRIYGGNLSSRLLARRRVTAGTAPLRAEQADPDAEAFAVQCMHQYLGPHYAAHAAGMLNDVALSAAFEGDFTRYFAAWRDVPI